MNNEDQVLTASQAAKMLHIHINTLRRWIKIDYLKSAQIGLRRDHRIPRSEINRILEIDNGNEQQHGKG